MSSLHAYWDGLVGTGDDPDAVNRLAEALYREYPQSAFADELTRMNIGQWAKESIEVCLKTFYRDLDPNITRFQDHTRGATSSRAGGVPAAG